MNHRASFQMRSLAAAVATLWLALPLGAVLHAGHEHQICAEHGVLEEKSTEKGGEGLRLTAVVALSHQACATLAASSRVPTDNARIEAPVPFWMAFAVAPAEQSRDASAPLTLLSFAPNSSPPRA
ncbi:MAG: hypothetical protein ACT4TC_05100 [Myxococcaceae bacterium]